MTENRKNIIYSIIAALCFVILLAGGLVVSGEVKLEVPEQTQAQSEYYMVVMGDSILGEERDETSVPAQIEKMLGEPVFNGALGGTSMGRGNMEGYDSVINDALSMASLTKSIVGRDNTVQQTIMANWGGMDHFPETIAQLLEIDFSKVQVLLIGHTLNDYHAGEPIEDDGQWDNEYTFVGALRSTIRTLQKAYPDLRIILVSAPYTWYREHNLTCEEYVLGGNILEDYVNAQIAVAKETGVELIDLYHEGYPHESWEDCATYTNDGLHPNEQGRELLAQIIAEYFLTHPDEEKHSN